GLGYDFGGFYWEATRCPFSGLVTIAVEGDHWKGLVFASAALVAEYARQPVSVLVHRLIERAGSQLRAASYIGVSARRRPSRDRRRSRSDQCP
ncbi:MAG: hypothetical protein EBY52_05340, partial [Actinobacteria bacterium]|nr:hypothetical protein [Actinomycetota bacterium]